MMSESSEEDTDRVSSELYEEFDYSTALQPNLSDQNVVSKFAFNIPQTTQTDADGDLLVARKVHSCNKYVINIEHSKRTALDLVGLQIWRGALLLADWLIHNQKLLLQSSNKDGIIMELGSGVGLTSIVAGMFAPVICTDINIGGLLNLIRNNIKLNEPLLKYDVNVLELDFNKEFSQEIERLLPRVELVMAADVVYDDSLTEAFIKIVQKLMNMPGKRLYVALEKRYVFTIADCDTCAPCYEYFLECLHKVTNASVEEVPLDFPQYFEYDRVKELVLWKITSLK